MEEIMQRVEILENEGIISSRTKECGIDIIKKRYDLYNTSIPFITHFLMSLERGYANTQLDDNNISLLTQLKRSNCFDKAYEELLWLENQSHIIWNECERIYLLMHLIQLF